MPRILLLIVLIFARIGNGTIALKNKLITGSLYFIVLAPAALVNKFIPIRREDFHARKSSWIDVDKEEKS